MGWAFLRPEEAFASLRASLAILPERRSGIQRIALRHDEQLAGARLDRRRLRRRRAERAPAQPGLEARGRQRRARQVKRDRDLAADVGGRRARVRAGELKDALVRRFGTLAEQLDVLGAAAVEVGPELGR